jgi:probable HAF family extracellular repeat protein
MAMPIHMTSRLRRAAPAARGRRLAAWVISCIAGLAAGGGGPCLAGECMYEIVAAFTEEYPSRSDPGNGGAGLVLNDHNEVVGWYSPCLFCNDRAFYWSQETGFLPLPIPFPVSSSRAMDISNNGWITGNVDIAGDGLGYRGFIMRRDGSGLELILPLPGHPIVQVLAVSDNKQVVGYCEGGEFLPNAFLWDNGRLIDLEPLLGLPYTQAWDINGSGAITGRAFEKDGDPWEVFLLQDGRVQFLPTLPGTAGGYGYSISESGRVGGANAVGVSFPQQYLGFIWNGGVTSGIEMLPECDSSAVFDVSDGGYDIGGCGESVPGRPGILHTLIWINDRMYALDDILCLGDGHVFAAYGVNDAGYVLASVYDLPYVLPGDELLAPLVVSTDLTRDGIVNGFDLATLLGRWGPCFVCPGDFNDDNVINGLDVMILLDYWGPVAD